MTDYICYVLKSTNSLYLNCTYNGSTNNLSRRLRQHNGEISGGAKATKGKGPWEPYIIIKGFGTHREALSCEWKIKHPTNTKKRPSKYNGVIGRVKSLNEILNLDKWTNNSTGLESGNIYKLYLLDEHIDYIDLSIKKSNIEISNFSNIDNI